MEVTFRKIQPIDCEILACWIAQDPPHRDMKPEFFARPVSFVIESEDKPLCYVRMEAEPNRTLRLHMQFGPNRRASLKGLLYGWAKFLQAVNNAAAQRLIFESTSPALIKFLKRYGFSGIPGTNDYELFLPEAQHAGRTGASRAHALT